jgi:hypothetical protein
VDAFLRRVVEQREREQEEVLLRPRVAAELPNCVSVSAVSPGVRARMQWTGAELNRALDDAKRALAAAPSPSSAPSLYEVLTQQEVGMKRCACGKGIHVRGGVEHNQCFICRKRGGAGAVAKKAKAPEAAPTKRDELFVPKEVQAKFTETPARPSPPFGGFTISFEGRIESETSSRFRMMAQAMGRDPGRLVEDFQRDWLERAVTGANQALGLEPGDEVAPVQALAPATSQALEINKDAFLGACEPPPVAEPFRAEDLGPDDEDLEEAAGHAAAEMERQLRQATAEGRQIERTQSPSGRAA